MLPPAIEEPELNRLMDEPNPRVEPHSTPWFLISMLSARGAEYACPLWTIFCLFIVVELLNCWIVELTNWLRDYGVAGLRECGNAGYKREKAMHWGAKLRYVRGREKPMASRNTLKINDIYILQMLDIHQVISVLEIRQLFVMSHLQVWYLECKDRELIDMMEKKYLDSAQQPEVTKNSHPSTLISPKISFRTTFLRRYGNNDYICAQIH